MIQKMFAIRDSKACAFLQPFFSSANGSALRALSDAVSDGKSPLALHPEDYILYEVGSFDDNTGEIVGVTPIKLLACASDFREGTEVRTPISNQRITPEMMEYTKVPKDLLNGKK